MPRYLTVEISEDAAERLIRIRERLDSMQLRLGGDRPGEDYLKMTILGEEMPGRIISIR